MTAKKRKPIPVVVSPELDERLCRLQQLISERVLSLEVTQASVLRRVLMLGTEALEKEFGILPLPPPCGPIAPPEGAALRLTDAAPEAEPQS